MKLMPVVALLAVAARAEIIDRIAVAVGNQVITTSDIDREIRIAAFLDGVKPDLTATAKRAAADRMVEQMLMRREIRNSRYPEPPASEVLPVLEKFKKQNFASDEEYQRSLREDGITEKDVIAALVWQRTMLRFVELRFGANLQVSEQEMRDRFEQVEAPAARAANPGQPPVYEDARSRIQESLIQEHTDRQIDDWLKEVRQRTVITYHE